MNKSDAGHRSASFLTEEQLSQGETFNISGYDGTQKTLLQVEGEMNEKKGVFEYIITQDGKISHQRFIIDGVINGSPNQVIPKGGK